MKTNYLKKYIISSYILVWMLIIFVAGSASLIFHAPPVIMWIVRNIIAWSPTYLLLIGWKQFRPNETRMESKAVSVAVLLCPHFCHQRVITVPLFHYDGKADVILHQFGNDSIAA